MKKLLVIFLYTTSLCASEPLLFTSKGEPSEPLKKILAITNIPHTHSVNSIVSATQRQQECDGWLRSKNMERWQIKERHPKKREQLMPLFKQLGILNTIGPMQYDYTYALLHGGPIDIIRLRLAYLAILWHRNMLYFKELVVFTGQRKLDSNIENKESLYADKNSILPFKKSWKPINTLPTHETDMIKLVFEQTELPRSWGTSVKITFIDTPADNSGYRPTTRSTIKQWFEKCKPMPGRIIAISNQPYVHYQHEVLRGILPPTYKAETIGPAAPKDIKVAVILDALARLLYQKQQNKSINWAKL